MNIINKTQPMLLSAVASVCWFALDGFSKEELHLRLTIDTLHTGNITSLSFSPDNKTLASGSVDKTVKLWAVNNGGNTDNFKGHTNQIRSVAFSPDGRFVASGCWDNTINIWHVGSGKKVITLDGHSQQVLSIAFSPDGKTLASGGTDQTIKLWDLTSMKEIATWKGHRNQVCSVAFSPSGRILASGSWDRTIRLWEVASGQNVAIIENGQMTVSCVTFSPDGKLLASAEELTGKSTPAARASVTCCIKLWDTATGNNIAVLEKQPGNIYTIAFSPDGKTLVSGGANKAIIIWDVATRKSILRRVVGGAVRSVAISPDGKTLASADGLAIRLWDIKPTR